MFEIFDDHMQVNFDDTSSLIYQMSL